ncbi:MAG: hypothetical protein ACXADB_09295, partial [Candidatus Hermodarchaeia archaeon]
WMNETETPSTLVNVGGWLQIPFALFMIFISFWLLLILWPILIDPLFWTAFGWWTLLMMVALVITGVFGLSLSVLWLRWRHDIPGNKSRLIKTGIIGMIFSGTIPGLLVLIGAAIYPTGK